MFKQTQENVLYFLLDINIKALDNIINDPDSFNDWEILLLNYQSSTQEMVQKVKYIKSFLSSFKTIGGFQLSSHIVLGEIIKNILHGLILLEVHYLIWRNLLCLIMGIAWKQSKNYGQHSLQ